MSFVKRIRHKLRLKKKLRKIYDVEMFIYDLKNKYPKNILVFCLNRSGETYYSLALAQAIEEHYNKKPVYFLADSMRDIAKLFDTYELDINYLPRSSLLEMQRLLESIGRSDILTDHVIPAIHDTIPNYFKQLDYSKLKFYLPKESKLLKPSCGSEIDMDIEHNKTVVLSPEANAVSFKDDDFWSKLKKQLKNAGYTVYVNSSVKAEGNLFIGRDQMYALVEKGGYFVGLRSGLCDILSESNAKKIVIYPGDISGLAYNKYSLNQQGQGINIVELFTSDEELIDKIIKEIN